jgi:hypothetical protein
MNLLKKLVSLSLRTLQAILNWLDRSPWVSFALIFSLAFALRFNDLMKIPGRHITPNAQWELGSIAISLVETGQFANPYMLPTGPTAHLPPVYPALFAIFYTLLGITPQAGYVSLGFIAMTNSVMCAIMPWLGSKIGTGSQAGVIGGIAGAFMLEWSAHGEGLTGILLGLLLVAFLQRWGNGQNSFIGSLLFGLGIGVAFHVQPVLLVVVLGCLSFEIWWRRNGIGWTATITLVLGAVLACVPWAWRNYTVFNEFFFIRSNLGLEIRMGNQEGAAAAMEVMDITEPGAHPRTHYIEAHRLRQMGEMDYMRRAMNDTMSWIRDNPGKFLQLTTLRFIHFWFGPLHRPYIAAYITALTILAMMGAKRIYPRLSCPKRTVILVPLLTYPLIYYIVPYMVRYRTPIDWILLILAGVEVWRWIEPERQHTVIRF